MFSLKNACYNKSSHNNKMSCSVLAVFRVLVSQPSSPSTWAAGADAFPASLEGVEGTDLDHWGLAFSLQDVSPTEMESTCATSLVGLESPLKSVWAMLVGRGQSRNALVSCSE